jgi:hypothetical protein
MVRPDLWRGVKAVGREAATDIGDNTLPDVKPREIVGNRVGDSVQNLIQKLRGRGHKRAAAKSWKKQTKNGKPPSKNAELTKRDIFSSNQSVHAPPCLRKPCQ